MSTRVGAGRSSAQARRPPGGPAPCGPGPAARPPRRTARPDGSSPSARRRRPARSGCSGCRPDGDGAPGRPDRPRRSAAPSPRGSGPAPGRRGDDKIVAGPSQRDRRRSGGSHGEDLEDAARRRGGRHRRPAVAAGDDLTGQGARQVDAPAQGTEPGAPWVGPARRLETRRQRPPGTGQVDRHRDGSGSTPVGGGRFCRRPGTDRNSDGPACGRRSGRSGNGAVEQEAEEREPPEAVRDHVVGSKVDGRPTALEAADHRDVPHREIGVERHRLREPDQVEDLAWPARRAPAWTSTRARTSFTSTRSTS